MLSGEPYLADDAVLVAERQRARVLLSRYNATAASELQVRREILQDLLGAVGSDVWIEPPFYCDYGSNIAFGKGVYLNFGCVLLDCNRIAIGDYTKLAPSVQVYTCHHPVDPETRLGGRELATPVTIGRNVWVGGGSIICPGVTIGDETTIGAGSVVAHDIPPRVLAVGNPCRVVRGV